MKAIRTEVKIEKSQIPVSRESEIMMLGSCFTTNIGEHLKSEGYNVLINPFGVLFNPASIASSFKRMVERKTFLPEDIIDIGLHTTEPSGGEKRLPIVKFCSFYHHSSLARESASAFLSHANQLLSNAAEFLERADTIIVTLGTSWVFRHIKRGYIVSNCHKINPKEFQREFLPLEESERLLSDMVTAFPQKRFIFTVSPIRHFKDGAHANSISKSSLLLAVERVCKNYPNAGYFPSYEIMLDELRDYEFYAEDLVHPSPRAIEYIYSKFKETFGME